MNDRTQAYENMPKVSVLISSKSRRNLLEQTVASLFEMDYPREKFEVVVVEETDCPQPLGGTVHVSIPVENRGFVGYTRNVAVTHARYSIVAFTDDDCIVDRKWLRELVKAFGNEYEEVAGVAGGVLVKDAGVLGRCENVLGFPGGGLRYIHDAQGHIVPTRFLSTCNCAYRKEVLDEVGYFEPDSKYGAEDYDLARRVLAKHMCVFNPHAVVYHKPRDSIWGIFKWFARRGSAETSFELPCFKNASHVMGVIKNSLIIRLALLVPVLMLLRGHWAELFLSLGLIYYLVNLSRYRFQLKMIDNKFVFFVTPLVKFLMDLGSEWGRIRGLFFIIVRKLGYKCGHVQKVA